MFSFKFLQSAHPYNRSRKYTANNQSNKRLCLKEITYFILPSFLSCLFIFFRNDLSHIIILPKKKICL